jgi:hypothetical protein
LYGLTGSQLSSRTDVPLATAPGQPLTNVAAYVSKAFGIEGALVPWSLVILAGHIAFVRVTSVMALRYVNFLRR